MPATPVTKADVYTVFYQLQDSCRRLGMTEAAKVLDIQEGSESRAWRLFSLSPVTRTPIFGWLPESTFLGKTNREAQCTLRGMIAGLEAAFQHEDKLSASLLSRPRPIIRAADPYSQPSPSQKGGLIDGLY